MRRVVESVTGVANGATIPVDYRAGVFGMGFGVVISGTITYTVQHTFDDIYALAASGGTPTWFNHAFVAAQSANMDGNYAFPVAAIRLITTAGTGTATLTALSNSGQG